MLCNILHHNGHILCYFGKDRNTERLYQLWCSSGPGSGSAHPPSSGGAPEEVTTAADAGDQEAEGDHFSGSKQLQPKLLDIVTSQRDRFRARYALWLRPLFPLASLSSHPQQGLVLCWRKRKAQALGSQQDWSLVSMTAIKASPFVADDTTFSTLN